MLAASGALTLLWGMPQLTAPHASHDPGALATLDQVAPADIDAALATMNISPGMAASLKQQSSGCRQPLAWVSIARAPGTAGGTARLVSGRYGSPIFKLTDVPLRVAIPYPAPYQSGHGTLSLLSDAGGAVVGLTPAWHTPAHAGRSVHDVSWTPGPACGERAP